MYRPLLTFMVGWQCCTTRVLTFDEFLDIPPCTTGKHSTVNDAPNSKPAQSPDVTQGQNASPKPVSVTNTAPTSFPIPRIPRALQPEPSTTATPAPESDSDDSLLAIPPGKVCKRHGCNAVSPSEDSSGSREAKECIYHPGQALFHEGSKGWTCCKRRVLEFDEFLKIEGCKRKNRHLFIGRHKTTELEEALFVVRHDFYQTTTTVIASYYLKKIDKGRAKVEFTSPTTVTLDLPTAENKRYRAEIPLFGKIDPVKSTYKIMSTKLELSLTKAEGLGWPVLRSDENRGSDIIQVGQAGIA
ncbi:MAG: hypothetical protein Q9191_000422 [Dirinaria sp. TL-2023a]